MRLIDLDPRWVKTTNPDFGGGDPSRFGMGLSFLSPLKTGLRINIWFKNPLDGKGPINEPEKPRALWERKGNTFDTLTLTPSIDVTSKSYPNEWHGNITNGQCIGGGAQ